MCKTVTEGRSSEAAIWKLNCIQSPFKDIETKGKVSLKITPNNNDKII